LKSNRFNLGAASVIPNRPRPLCRLDRATEIANGQEDVVDHSLPPCGSPPVSAVNVLRD
jgi:hypothetical protein